MRRRGISRLTALGCALVVALTGCRLPAGGGSSAVGPPPGGWPQPAGDRVTKSLCGLLTTADYKNLGHVRQTHLTDFVNDQDNNVDCQYQATDEMTLTLEPTADYAHYVFAADLMDHRKQLAKHHRRPDLTDGVVGAANESWFDLWTQGTAQDHTVAHELRLRRGSLILAITLGGDRGKAEKDPRSVLVALAGLVLRRLPKAGLQDTGTQHKVQYAAVGRGRARWIDWRDYTDVQSAGGVSNVPIPWLKTVPMATFDGTTPDPPYLRLEASSRNAKVGCLIVVDNVPVAAEKPKRGVVDCQGDFPDSGGGSHTGGAPSAQPAMFSR